MEFKVQMIAILQKAKEEAMRSKRAKDQQKAQSTQLLISAIEERRHFGVFRKAFDSKCACDDSVNLPCAVQNKCAKCCLEFIWQIGKSGLLPQEPILHKAADAGSVDCVELLAPFDHMNKDGKGMPALSWAIFGKGEFREKRRMVEILSEYPCQFEGICMTDLMFYALFGDLAGVREHLDQIGQTDRQGRTALMYAAAMGYMDIVDILVEEAGMQDEDGFTALMFAVKASAISCVQKLIGKEAKKQASDGKTALMLALANSNLACALALVPLEAGERDDADRTALMLAAQGGFLECVRQLVSTEGGMQEKDGSTALIRALSANRPDCAIELIPSDGGLEDVRGKNATYFAIQYHQTSCLGPLLAHEREAALVPPQMRAAFSGDVKTLMATRDKWKTIIWDNCTVMHFALAGGRTRTIRLLARDEKVSQFFADEWYRSIGLLLNTEAGAREALPIVVRLDEAKRCRTYLILLFNQYPEEARLLRPFCSLTPNEDTREKLEACLHQAGMARFLDGAKNVGVVFEGCVNVVESLYEHKTILELDVNDKEDLARQLSQNPIRQKQITLARKQKERRGNYNKIPPEKQFSVREMGSEAAFNRLTLLESRDAFWKSISSQRRVEEPRASSLRFKQARNRLLIRNTVAYAKAQLRKMMNE